MPDDYSLTCYNCKKKATFDSPTMQFEHAIPHCEVSVFQCMNCAKFNYFDWTTLDRESHLVGRRKAVCQN